MIGIISLARKRQEHAEAKAKLSALIDNFHNTEAYLNAATAVASTSESLDFIERQIREQAAEEYRANKNKHPHPAVEITLTTEIEIKDRPAAAEWCFAYLPLALVLDEKFLISTARSGHLPPVKFLDVKEDVVKVRIAKDLSPYLEENENG